MSIRIHHSTPLLRAKRVTASQPLPALFVSFGWLIMLGGLVLSLALDRRLRDSGRADLSDTTSGAVLFFLLPLLSSMVVGSALALRRPRHPVGWLFLALGLSMAIDAPLETYAVYGAVARPGTLPAADFTAVLTDIIFIPWLALLGLIMLLTPDGRLPIRLWRIAAGLTVSGGVVSFLCGFVRPYRGDYADLGTIHNPLEISRLHDVVTFGGVGGIIVMHVGVLLGALSLVVRFRAARDAERLQMRWLGLAALPFAALVIGAYVAATYNQDVLLALFGGGFLSIIPIAAALAIEQYHLYDVERLISRGLAWLLLSAVLVGCYVGVVVFVGESLNGWGGNASHVPAIIATLATVSILGPARRFLQDALDRRFNRRRFDAIALVRSLQSQLTPDFTIEQALQAAVGDAQLTVAYWIDERDRWVRANGEPVVPADVALILNQQGQPAYAISYALERVERTTLEAVAAVALAELENARLRAAIALQLVEVRESRARIVAAQLAERHKIERNLHDGAQQRLLALALELRAAELSDQPERMQVAISGAVDELQVAVRELRDLANGLAPSVLNDGGLAAALDDLAARSPVPVRLQATDRRFSPAVEETAWFIACEAVANAVKHARPRSVSISAEQADRHLRLVIEDDGRGGADPSGSGLRGIADRAEAVGGQLTVHERPGRGTIITAELPCAS